ncbi:hypothetical protein [Caballeronia sordidicola]|uniref:hypothetical protein n=1 Tax=Caballeronia sordidicola TaxID=196367 RepID=UPI00117FF909|nr:hypothetical protein [Caballeronia sordidicola]
MKRTLGLQNYRFWNLIGISMEISRRSDKVGLWNNNAGMLLAKMSAETIFCQNLICGLLLVAIAHHQGLLVSSVLDNTPNEIKIFVAALMVIAVIHRNVVFLYRQSFLYEESCLDAGQRSRKG